MVAEPRLTAKRQSYVEARISGLGPSDAYRSAFNPPTMSDKAISVEAARLEKNPSVSLALSTAHAQAVQSLNITAQDIARVAWEIAGDEGIQPAARVSALALLAKRHPEFSEKHEVDARVGVMLVRQTRDLNASG